MDQTRREALTAELEDARKERDRLTMYMETLALRLGIAAESAAPSKEQEPSGAGPGALGLTDDALTLVHANEFHGMSMPKAAQTVLSRWSPDPYTRPIKTTALMHALKKGGLDIKDARQIYRALYTAARFHNVGGGQWGFAKWYPTSVRTKGGKGGLNGAEATSQPSAGDHAAADPASADSDLPSDISEGETDREDTGS